MSADVRVVPVTPAAFERASARDGAGPIEEILVAAAFAPEVPITFRGLRMAGGHYLVRNSWIGDELSGTKVLTFTRFDPVPFHWFRSLLPIQHELYMGIGR